MAGEHKQFSQIPIETSVTEFDEIHAKELDAINNRRARINEHAALKRDENLSVEPKKAGTNSRPVVNTIGLALSGGGIRSASFCMGVLQALDANKVFNRVDYLSTVSGGGYIGASLTTAMSKDKGKFPFESTLDQDEPPRVQHIRNFSNYLFPDRAALLENLMIYLRGLAANAILILPIILFAVVITIFIANVSNIHENKYGSVPFFTPTIVLALTFVVLLASYACAQLWKAGAELPSEFVGWLKGLFSIAVVVLFVEFNLFLLSVLIENAQAVAACEATKQAAKQAAASTCIPQCISPCVQQCTTAACEHLSTFGKIVAWIKSTVTALAPLAAIVAFLSNKIGAAAATANTSDWRATIGSLVGKLALYIAAIVLPLLLWALYLELSIWGIPTKSGVHLAPDWFQPLEWPKWLQDMEWFEQFKSMLWPRYLFGYLIVALILFGCWVFLTPNGNSMHGLYRDRLGKAFLFFPAPKQSESTLKNDVSQQAVVKLSDIDPEFAPYHIMGAALNIQGSAEVNRRGRNADFFMFSPFYIGSPATGYALTTEVEDKDKQLDISSAMTISGAAFTANAGSVVPRVLTPTLAMLNVRLGYWLPNPKRIRETLKVREKLHAFLWEEITSQLNETSAYCHVTDGGHLENLGIYELLKRRCRLIIAVDAEADPEMNFTSFMQLQQYARIDLGVRIELPWKQIKEKALAYNEGRQSPGPHCAIGKIYYPAGEGYLIYIKSSLTHDENDYVADYKRRFPTFPHEDTLDQLFSEEQFEVYRALGFHALNRVMKKSANDWETDNVSVYTPGLLGGMPKKFWADDELLTQVRDTLGIK